MFEFLLDLLKLLKFMVIAAFIGNPVILTSSPIDIKAGSRLVFEPEKPLRVLTPGAHISINVTSMAPVHVDDMRSAWDWAEETFGQSSISATLINTSNGNEKKLYGGRGVSWGGNSDMHLSLRSNEEVGSRLERGKTYDKIIVETDVELRGVTMVWNSWRL